MAKREIYYGPELWKDSKFGVVAARDWLAAINSDNRNLLLMIRGVANGEYVNINNKITDFVVELQRSKHGDNETIISAFFGQLIAVLVQHLDPEVITKDGLTHLRKNACLIELPDIAADIDDIIRNRNKTLIPK